MLLLLFLIKGTLPNCCSVHSVGKLFVLNFLRSAQRVGVKVVGSGTCFKGRKTFIHFLAGVCAFSLSLEALIQVTSKTFLRYMRISI